MMEANDTSREAASKGPEHRPDEEPSLSESAVPADHTVPQRVGEARRMGEPRFREMIDALPEAIYTTDTEGRLTHFNPAAVAFSGRVPKLGADRWCVTWKRYELDGTPIPLNESPLAIAIKEDRSIRGVEGIAERPDGTRVWFEAHPTPLRDDDGKIVGGINMLVDVTERRRSEEALRQSEQRLHFALEAGGIGSWEWDIDRDAVTWSENLEAIHGLRPGEFDGRFETFINAVHPDDREQLLAAIRGALEEDAPYHVQHRWVRRDGEVIWLEGRGQVVRDEDGRPVRMTGTCTDVTERKREAQFQEEQNRLLELIATGAPLEECLSTLCSAVPRLSPGVRACILLADDERRGFTRSIAPDLRPSFGQGLEGISISDRAEGPCGQAVFHGRPVACEDIAGDETWSKPWRELCLAHDVLACHSTPIRDEDGAPQGSFIICFDEPRALDAWEQRLVDFGTHVACIAIDRDRARQALRESAERADFRATLTDALRPLTDAVEIQNEAVRILGEHLGVSRALYAEITDDEAHVEVRDEYLDGVPRIAGRYRLGVFGPPEEETEESCVDCTIVMSDVDDEPHITDEARAVYAAAAARAHIGVPLVKEGRFVAALAVHQSEPRAWTDEEVALVEETAERTWAAVERARAEASLRESEERYRTLFESIDEGFCVVEVLFDDDGQPVDYRFLRTNPAFEQQTGLVDAEGRRMRALVPGHEEHWFEIYGRVASTGKPSRFVAEARQLGGRWYSVYAFRLGGSESRKVAILFNDITERKWAEEALIDLTETLEERVERRTEQVRELTSRLTMAEQKERRRIARILHDDLQQRLYGIQMKMTFLRRHAEAGTREQLLEQVRQAEAWMNEAIATTRQLSVDLSPPVLKKEGLGDALGWLQTQMKELHGLEVDLRAERAARILDEDMRVFLFQVVRELLFNVVKHAGTGRATVALASAGEQLVIRVADDGCGFDPDEVEGRAHEEGFGLTAARERLALFGGRLKIVSAPGEGTRVTVHAPLDPGRRQASEDG